MPWRRPAAAAVLSTLALVACNDDGRTLAPAPEVPASPLTTSTTTTSTSTTSAVLDADVPLSVRSPGLAEGARLPVEHTCDGADVQPPLVFAGAPSAAAELAVAVVDLDADGYVHWVVAGLPAGTLRLDAGDLPPSAVEARAGDGEIGWRGPCPPPGDGAHRYEFRVYAMAEPVGLAPGLAGRDAVEILEEAAVDVGRYTLRYERRSG